MDTIELTPSKAFPQTFDYGFMKLLPDRAVFFLDHPKYRSLGTYQPLDRDALLNDIDEMGVLYKRMNGAWSVSSSIEFTCQEQERIPSSFALAIIRTGSVVLENATRPHVAAIASQVLTQLHDSARELGRESYRAIIQATNDQLRALGSTEGLARHLRHAGFPLDRKGRGHDLDTHAFKYDCSLLTLVSHINRAGGVYSDQAENLKVTTESIVGLLQEGIDEEKEGEFAQALALLVQEMQTHLPEALGTLDQDVRHNGHFIRASYQSFPGVRRLALFEQTPISRGTISTIASQADQELE